MITLKASALKELVVIGLLLVFQGSIYAGNSSDKQKRTRSRPLTRLELKEAKSRLVELGYGKGRNALVMFQKWERRKVTGNLTRDDFDILLTASAPAAKDFGYRHVEVDLDRQILILTDNDGNIKQFLPVSTGSNKRYKEKRASGLAYTPRGRFRIYAKISGWRESPLGLLYYPSYFSDGLAIHGNPSVPRTPQSHGCVRIPMSAAVSVSKLLPVGTIVLIYDKDSFVSAKDWAEADRIKADAVIRN